jgi:serine phosphatase RsbU (regulator of sigma subunit)/PAS domain-containing protein
MASSAAESRPPAIENKRRALSVVLGVAVVVALALIDVGLGANDVIIGTVVLGPLLCGLIGGARDVALVGAFATGVAAISGVWNDNFDSVAYFLRLAVVISGAVIAMLASARWWTITRDRSRFAVLSGVAEVADGTLTLEQTAERVTALVVPAVADFCAIDVLDQGDLRRLTVRAAGPGAAAAEVALRSRAPSPPGTPGSRDAVTSLSSQLVERADDALLRRLAHDDEDLERLRSLGLRSTVAVPLMARGRALGALTVGVTVGSGRTYGREDLAFVEVLAGRVALALDNAGLFFQLQTIEAQLGAALSSLAEAVTIQRAEGALIYANEAAARMLEFDSPQALLAAPVADIIAAFDSYREDGSPLTIEDLPGRKVLAGEDAEPLVVRAVSRATGEERWRITKSTAVRDPEGHVTLVVNVIDDITDVKRAEISQRLLARVGKVLASSLDHDQTLQQVAELAVPQLADWCAVSLPDGRGYLRTVAVAHTNPDKVAFARLVSEQYPTPSSSPGGAAQVMRDATSQVVNDVTPEMLAAAAQDDQHAQMLAQLGMRAALVVPMLAGARAIGTLVLVSAESGRRFEPRDVELAEELARRAGTAVENARLYTERSHIARALQTGLLPDALPAIAGWRMEALYRPAGAENWVGGDFYDAVEVPGGWLVLVGDVAGHGAEAAALTGLARHTLRSTARLLADPLDAIAQLNQELTARERMSLCTVAAVLLTERHGAAQAEIVCAGHPPPLLLADGHVASVGRFGPMLGAYRDEQWERVTVNVDPGAVLVLYTDGVLDTVGEQGHRFGEPRLQQTVKGVSSAADAVARIDAALRRFELGAQADDTAVLAVERVGAPARETFEVPDYGASGLGPTKRPE